MKIIGNYSIKIFIQKNIYEFNFSLKGMNFNIFTHINFI